MRGLELSLQLPSPLQELYDDRLGEVRVFLKREDLIHPELTGNKWRKLKYLLADAGAASATTLLTFGGAYSNHLRAVAAAGRMCGFGTIGVVRGEERPFNEVLAAAAADGMQLHYLDRAMYWRKNEPEVIAASDASSATSIWYRRAAALRSPFGAVASSWTRSTGPSM